MTREVLRSQQRKQETRRLPAGEVAAIATSARNEIVTSTLNHMIFGLAALAAPVFGPDRRLEVVLGIVLPARMFTPAAARTLGPQLRSVADAASADLGFVAD